MYCKIIFFRYIVACEDIDLGETIVKESPLTFSLHRDHFGTHCQNCFAPIRGVVPCLRCSWVCYCSSDCREIASKSYHKYECGILKLLLESGFNCYPYLALRALCKEGLSNLLAMKNDLVQGRSEEAGTSESMIANGLVYSSTDFRNLNNLMAHEETITDDQWLLRTLVAVYLLKCLQITDFFDNDNEEEPEVTVGPDELTEDELFIGALLLHLLNVLPCNVHDVSEYENPVKDQFARGAKQVSLGAAMYPTLALFNHSCTPSFMRCNRGNGVICVTSKAIKAGEEICENYGLMFTSKPLAARKRVLKEHYKFDCICECCSENWPTLGDLKDMERDDQNESK